MPHDLAKMALTVVDVRAGFADPGWEKRNNPAFEENLTESIAAWRDTERPVVFVRHDSIKPESPLRPGQSGNDLRDQVSGGPDLLVTKTVNSAF
jgi:nicotinamidase-related amidase